MNIHETYLQDVCDLLLIVFHPLSHVRSYVNMTINVRFEVCTELVTKRFIFWDITPCSPLEVNQHFRGTFRLYV
jgi:hypothetical protein